MTDQFDIVVVGGGIAGLVAGITAAEGGSTVAVLDSHAAGGRARTTVRDGYHYNIGPHALYLAGSLLPFLVARGVEPHGGMPDTTHVRLLRDGALHPLSFGARDIATTKLLRPRSRVRILSLLARVPRMKPERFVGMPWAEFLGNEPDDVAGLLAMLVRTGTYVNAPATFDAGAAIMQLQAALRGVRYLDGGWQTIVHSLRGVLAKAGGVLFEDRAALSMQSDRGVDIDTSRGPVHSKAAVVAGLAPDAVTRLTDAAIGGRDRLGGVVHAAALDLALRREHHGLVLGIDQPLYLSPHAPVAALAPTGAGLVSLLRYTPDGEVGSADEDRAQLRELAAMSGIADDVIVHERYLHRLVVANGHPAAAGGGLAGRPTVDALGLDDVFIAGDWVGRDFQLADASAASAQAAAQRALAVVRGRSRVVA